MTKLSSPVFLVYAELSEKPSSKVLSSWFKKYDFQDNIDFYSELRLH